jgi:hypothetical protein
MPYAVQHRKTEVQTNLQATLGKCLGPYTSTTQAEREADNIMMEFKLGVEVDELETFLTRTRIIRSGQDIMMGMKVTRVIPVVLYTLYDIRITNEFVWMDGR